MSLNVNDEPLNATNEPCPAEYSEDGDNGSIDGGLSLEEAKAHHQFGVINFRQLEKVAKKKRHYLVEGYIPEKSIGILVGEWGIGKSPFALQLLIEMAIGNRHFLGRYATSETPLKTLYVDLENAPDTDRQRA